jgi:polyphosphate glucokinase
MATLLGIDIGGTGIKGAPVDVTTGELIAPRERILTPQPATPEAVAKVVAELFQHFDWTGPAGAAFPAVIKDGVARSAANVDSSWIGTNAAELFTKETGAPVTVVNDADAAGVAEMEFGAGRGHGGVVLMVTLGTGIGSALFLDGSLVPNTELGHLEIRGKAAEKRAAESVREREALTWEKYARRLQEYFMTIEKLFSPDLIIIGGGISKKSEKFLPLLTLRTAVVAAALQNEAGIVGAAVAAAHTQPAASPG